MSTFEIIGVVATVVSAIVGVISIWKSDWVTRLRIERKQRQIQDIETARFRKYRNNTFLSSMDKSYWKERKLRDEIYDLRRDCGCDSENINNRGGL